MEVKSLFGHKIPLRDFHSDPIDSVALYPKIMPSGVRMQLIEYANENDMSELKAIITIIVEKFEG